jgi:hypothetical protein
MAERKVTAETVTAETPRAFRLWLGLLGPPATWAIQFQTIYLLSEWACYAMDQTWNHVVSVAALVLSVFCVWVAFSEWRACGGGTENERSDPDTRRRFMAILGMMLGALSTALIFATWLPTLTGVPCGR